MRCGLYLMLPFTRLHVGRHLVLFRPQCDDDFQIPTLDPFVTRLKSPLGENKMPIQRSSTSYCGTELVYCGI